MNVISSILATLVLICGVMIIGGGCYRINETEQVIITQFGEPVGDPIVEPGLHFKLPFIQTANRLEKRFLEWDGAPVGIPTLTMPFVLASWLFLVPNKDVMPAHRQ